MVFLISDEVKPKNGGPGMIVTGYSSGMVECRWHDGYGIISKLCLMRDVRNARRGAEGGYCARTDFI